MWKTLPLLTKLLGDPRIIADRYGLYPYLRRWYVIGRRKKGTWREKLPFNLFIHQFKMSDDADALHSHPFKWSLSLVLAGGYREERRVGDKVVSRLVTPGMFNFIRNDDYHRVDLLKEDAWSIFLAGPHQSDWYFWDRDAKRRAHWLNFTKAREEGREPDWEEDRRE